MDVRCTWTQRASSVTVFSQMGSITGLKRIVIEKLLADEDYFLIVIDPRHADVCLPDHLMETERPVGLNIGMRMAVDIPDLKLGDESISGTLSFNRTPFHCTFPWGSIMQVSVGEEHLVWVVPEQDDPSNSGEKPKLRVIK